MKIIATILFFLIVKSTLAQSDSLHFIKIHFLYGSKPKKEYKKTEFKSFGGIHGGHVSIEVDDVDYNFEPTYKKHIFPHKNKKADYVANKLNGQPRYNKNSKTINFIIPLTRRQYEQLNTLNQNYCDNTPYDYAFFGMRCANSTQDILGRIGVLKQKKRFMNIVTTFYPKKLRKRMFKVAKANNYQMIANEGSNTRKWEKD